MWLITKFGFFSIVQKPGDADAEQLTIRARVAQDLVNLRDHYLPEMGPITEGEGTDYRFRCRAARKAVARAMSAAIADIDYSNFKDEVAAAQGHPRAKAYGKIWSALYPLQDQHQAFQPSRAAGNNTVRPEGGKKAALGGVLINDHGQVLIREVAGHFDGEHWGFPKGKADAGESPEQAALREVREEVGYDAMIVGLIPGEWNGVTSLTRFFLMRPVGKPQAFDKETAAVRWVSPDEARRLIGQTTKASARKRDLEALDAALALLNQPS